MSGKELIMTLGPVQMDPEILSLGSKQVPYPRTAEYSEWYKEIDENLQYLFQTHRPVFTVSCSGTGVMQMAVDNLCTPEDTVLTFATGVFGRRWGQIARAVGANVIEFPVEEGKNVTPQLLLTCVNKYHKAKVVFLTYNETSTTALADIEGCAKLLKNTNKILVVDAVSALLAEPMYMDEWGVDVLLTSSQKALALPPGLGFISFSDKAWVKVEQVQCRSLYFDAKAYLRDWPRHQLPYTSSLSIILQLEKQLKYISKVGLSEIQEDYRKRTEILRQGLLERGFSFTTERMGNCTTAAEVPAGIDALMFTQKLKREEMIDIAPPYSGKSIVRIGNYGAIGEEEIYIALKRIDYVLDDMRK